MADKAEIQKIYPLSPMQAGMLYHDLAANKSHAYFEQITFRMLGDLSIQHLSGSFQAIVNQYDVFRTVFRYQKLEQPLQIVLKQRQTQIYYENISHMTENEKISFIEEFTKKDKAKGFSLSDDVLMRLSILRTAENTYDFIWSYHHIIMDGWSLGIMINQFFQIYQSLLIDRPYNPEMVTPYSNYIDWLEKQNQKEALMYWKDYLADYHQKAFIPRFGETKPADDYQLEVVEFSFDEALSKGLANIAVNNQVTLNTVFQVIWGILLQRYNNTNDVVFGAVVSGRPATVEGIEKMVGLFINTLPVRIKTGLQQSFSDVIKLVQNQAMTAEAYSYISLAETQTVTELKQDLIDHIIVFENYPVEKEITNSNIAQSVGLRITNFKSFEQTNYDFNIVVAPGRELTIKLNYNKTVYDEAFVSRIESHMKEIIRCVVKDPNIIMAEIDILSVEEQRKILGEFNDTRMDYPKDKTIQELFEAQVEKTPENIAVVFNNNRLTYRELNSKANQLAWVLREQGVAPDSVVGIMAGRSVEMIIGIMAILKAGGAYFPISPEYPAERIEFMLKYSGVKVLLTQPETAKTITFEGIIIHLQSEEPAPGDSPNPPLINHANHLAYVIYTSGSTGTPKGIMIEHHSVINLITGLRKAVYQEYESSLNVALIAPFEFDASVQQIFTVLLSGHHLYIIPDEVKRDADQLIQYLGEHAIDISDGTPVHLSIMSHAAGTFERLKVKHFIIGGEALSKNTVKGFLSGFGERRPKITNVYGPTECCVDVTSYPVLERTGIDIIPIGKPLVNTRIYIFDNHLRPVPLGVTGEIYIGGDGLARGYLNREDLTRERFIRDPWIDGERIYRTGDLGRWLPDGNIEFIGRSDQQVKIRGFRIELGEIESWLLKHHQIKEAIVVANEDGDHFKYLCAYFVARGEPAIVQLKEYLAGKLPDYMIPAYMIQLEKIPVTPNGKVDRKALLLPDTTVNSNKGYAAPENELENQLARILQEVLGIEKVGRYDNFFELGGHSLKAIILVSKIYQVFKITMPVSQIFKTPQIKEMAEYIRQTEGSTYSNIQPVEAREYYPVSSAQKGMFILSQHETGITNYNIPGATIIEGELQLKQFEEAFKALLQRHETLRTSFTIIQGAIVQKVHDRVEFNLEYSELQQDNLDHLLKNFIRPFDLSRAPLLRAKLVKLSESKYILMYDMHHIISDGISMHILIREFIKLYQGATLPKLRIQYKDFSIWQNEFLKSDLIKRQEEYWLKNFSGKIHPLNIPADYPRPSKRSFVGDVVSFELNREFITELHKIGLETETTLYMILLTVYNILLSKYTDREDIVVNSPIIGRPHPDLENIIGIFVNMIAFRNYPKSTKTFRGFLAEVRENALIAYENQDYPFDELVKRIDLVKDLSRNPLCDTVFAMENIDVPSINIDNLKFTPYPVDEDISKFDLLLTANPAGDRIGMKFQYSTALFKRKTVEKLAGNFITVLRQVIAEEHIKLGAIKLDTELFEAKSDIAQDKLTDFSF